MKLAEAESQLQSLQHLMQEIMEEAKVKCFQLERNSQVREEVALFSPCCVAVEGTFGRYPFAVTN